MGAMQREQRLLKQQLSDSIARVCETSLCHSGSFSVDALVGVQLDDGRVFIVNLHKSHSAAEPVNTSISHCSADDDGTSLDMQVDEIVNVKQESTMEAAGCERRSKRLEKKRVVSWKKGSSKAAAKSNKKKSTLPDGTRRARQTNNTGLKKDEVCVTDDVTDRCTVGKEDKHGTVERSQYDGFGGHTHCGKSVDADVKRSECNSCFDDNDDIDRAASPGERRSTAPADRTSDGTSDRAITELNSDELSRYDIDVGKNRQGTDKTDGDVVKWTCHVCGYSSAHRNNFERHLFLHDLTPDGKSHVCGECGKRCRDAHELRTHVSVKHRKQLFRCARCGDSGKAFQSRKALRYHVATKHTGEFRYRCAVCDKTFLYGAHFRTHMNVHDGVRQLCAHCGRQFNYRASLKKHMDTCEARRHDAATPPVDFRCEHCDRTFRSRSYLTDHVHTRHLRTHRYTCATCGAAFLYRTGLARHRVKCGAGSAPGARLEASGDDGEVVVRPQEETTFVDLLTEAGTETALLSAALQYVSHNTEQLTTRDDVTASLDVPVVVTSLSTMTTLTVASPDDILSTTATLTMASPDDVLSTTATQTVAPHDDVLSANSLQYVTTACCQATQRQSTTETCIESLQQGSVTQLFDGCPNSTLHLGGVASSHQDCVVSTVTAAPPVI